MGIAADRSKWVRLDQAFAQTAAKKEAEEDTARRRAAQPGAVIVDTAPAPAPTWCVLFVCVCVVG